MTSIRENIEQIKSGIGKVQLVVVSKYRSIPELEEVYASGHRDFGENRVQELIQKAELLPKDIKWHAIGHLQRNKVKYIVPFVHLIHSVDSIKLLGEIDKEAKKVSRVIRVLLQVHIGEESSKFGFNSAELATILANGILDEFTNIKIEGLMGMATLSDDSDQIRSEFAGLKKMYDQFSTKYGFNTLSMGMSGDYEIAMDEGSTMVRIGSLVFG